MRFYLNIAWLVGRNLEAEILPEFIMFFLVFKTTFLTN